MPVGHNQSAIEAIAVATQLEVRARERLGHAFPPAEHQDVRRVDEEHRRPHREPEARAPDPPPVVHEIRRVAQLVDEHQDQVQAEEEHEAGQHRPGGQVEAVGGEGVEQRRPAERDREGSRARCRQGRRGGAGRAGAASGSTPPRPTRTPRRCGAPGTTETAVSCGTSAVASAASTSTYASVRNPARVQRAHDLAHPGEVQLARGLEVLDHDLADRTGPVHEVEQPGLGRLEPVVDERPPVGGHGVVAPTALPEAPDLDPITDPGSVRSGVESRSSASHTSTSIPTPIRGLSRATARGHQTAQTTSTAGAANWAL